MFCVWLVATGYCCKKLVMERMARSTAWQPYGKSNVSRMAEKGVSGNGLH